MGPAIGLLGDVMLGRGVAGALASTPPPEVWDAELRAVAAQLDLLVCNLECCLSERGAPTRLVPGKPFFFRGPPQAAEALRAVGARVATLANNHALDYGPEALADTIEILTRAGIACVGAGPDPETARRGAVVSDGGVRLGVVAVADHPEEYAAAPGRWGTAYADLSAGAPGWLLEEVRRLRGACDLVVACPHWGPNMTTRPAPWQRALAIELRAAGADLVAGHSAHVFHGVGWEAGAPILYDLGDVLDDYAIDPELRNDLGVLAIWRPHDAAAPIELVALRLEFCRTRLATGADADWIARRVDGACAELGTRVERRDEQRLVVRGPA